MIKSRRTEILFGFFLVLLAFYIYSNTFKGVTTLKKDAMVKSVTQGSIDNIEVIETNPAETLLKIKYKLDSVAPDAILALEVPFFGDDHSVRFQSKDALQLGEHSIEMLVVNANSSTQSEFTTNKITALITGKEAIRKDFDLQIVWAGRKQADLYTKTQKTNVDDLYHESVILIDTGVAENIKNANTYLNAIITRDAKYAPAYIELARIAMKMNWNQEGLYQAEQLIKSAQNIDPDSINAKVLLGYVYTHQHKFDDALKIFVSIENSGTKNTWLWANWGQLLKFQGKKDEAIQKYLKAVSGQRQNNTYDRARMDAYINLFQMLPKESFDQIDALYSKRDNEYDDCPCCRLEHVKYLFNYENKYSEIPSLLSRAKQIGCEESSVMASQGFAYYLESKGSNAELLARARAAYPEGAKLFFELSHYKAGMQTLKNLVNQKSNIDIQNSEGQTALALAIMAEDIESMETLLKLGASPHVQMNSEGFPLALFPIVQGNQKIIDLLISTGTDYSKIQFMGKSGIEFAKGFPEVRVVKTKSKAI